MEDIQEFLGSLAESFYGRDEYTKMDRYRDFRRVFLDTEEGKRVLYELMGWGQIYGAIPSKKEQSDRDVFLMLGGRKIVLQLLQTINLEPKMDQPKQAVRKKPKR